MAAIDFPNAPTDGQIFAAPNGVTYVWRAAPGLWLPLATNAAPGWQRLGQDIVVGAGGVATIDIAVPSNVRTMMLLGFLGVAFAFRTKRRVMSVA